MVADVSAKEGLLGTMACSYDCEMVASRTEMMDVGPLAGSGVGAAVMALKRVNTR